MARRQSLEVITKLKKKKYVVLYLCSGGKEYTISLGLQANENTFQNGQFTQKYGINYQEMNQLVQSKRIHINNLIRQAYEKNVNSVEFVKNALETEKLGNNLVAITKNQTIAVAFENYVEQKRLKTINQISPRSHDRYVTEAKRLQMFDPKTKLSNMDIHWMNNFVKWMSSSKEVTLNIIDPIAEREYKATKTLKAGNATIKRMIQDLISFCKSITFTNSEIKFPIQDFTDLMNALPSESGDIRNIVSMSKEELKAFRDIKETLKHKWQIDTWNAYMVGVLTGQRYGDICQLTTAHITNDNELHISNEKTNFHVWIPVRTELMEIFNYYNGSFVGKIPTVQRLNINLRKILSQIDIFNKDEVKISFEIKQRISKTVKRWERFTFHTSRKTFVTLSIQNKCTYQQLKRWVGWQDFRTINQYMDTFRKSDDDLSILSF
jgi:integrase